MVWLSLWLLCAPAAPVGQAQSHADGTIVPRLGPQPTPPVRLEGVFLRRALSTGYGGMVLYVYRPFLLFDDGSVYGDPTAPPEDLDRAASQAMEPQKWGRVVTRDGATWHVRRAAPPRTGEAPDVVYRSVSALAPAPMNGVLAGRFQATGGTGNSAAGGQESVIVRQSWTFTPDGRFVREGAAGAANATVVAGATQGPVRGQYTVAGYAITLRYDDGRQERRFFARDSATTLLCLGTTLVTRRP